MMKKARALLLGTMAGIMVIGSAFVSHATTLEDLYEEYMERLEEQQEEERAWYESDEYKENHYWEEVNGKWRFHDGSYGWLRDTIQSVEGKEYCFDSYGYMVTNKAMYQADVAGYKTYHFFGPDGAKVYGGWGQDVSTGAWYYADFYGDLVLNGIVRDGDNFYIMNKGSMATGVVKLEWESDMVYNHQNHGQIEQLGFTMGWATLDCGATGALSVSQLPVSGGMTKEYEDKLRAYFGMDGSNHNNAGTMNGDEASLFAYADVFVDMAMAEQGIYEYTIDRQVKIESGMGGGFNAVYQVYIPSQHSHKYLTIYFTKDLISGDYVYHRSSF